MGGRGIAAGEGHAGPHDRGDDPFAGSGMRAVHCGDRCCGRPRPAPMSACTGPTPRPTDLLCGRRRSRWRQSEHDGRADLDTRSESCSTRSAGGSTGPTRTARRSAGPSSTARGGGTLNTTGTTVNKPSALTVNPATRTLYWSNSKPQRPLVCASGRQRRRRLAVPNTTTEGRRHGHDVRSGQPALLLGRPSIGAHGNIGYETLGTGPSGAGSLNTGTVATLNYPFAIAYNNGDGFAYWTNDNGKIGEVRTDIAGLGSGNLTTTGATTTSIPGGVPLNLTGIAIDERHFRVYWGGSWNGGTNRISYARLNNSGGADVDTTGATVSQPGGVALLDVPAPGLAPTVAGTPVTGSTLNCRPGQLAAGRHGRVLLALAELLHLRLDAQRRRDQQPDRAPS